MKNTAELLKSTLLNGGFACFVRKCGHMGEVSQWQDIHQVLTAMYGAIMKLAIIQYTVNQIT